MLELTCKQVVELNGFSYLKAYSCGDGIYLARFYIGNMFKHSMVQDRYYLIFNLAGTY